MPSGPYCGVVTMAAVTQRFNSLKPTSLGWLALLLVLVVAVHWVALDWLRAQVTGGSTATLMPQPLFMRVIQPVATAIPKRSPHRKATAPRVAAATSTAFVQTELATDERPEPEAPGPGSVASDPPLASASHPKPEAAELPETHADEAANSWPADTRLSYDLKGYYRGDFYGSGQVQWQHIDGHYQVHVDLRVAVFFTATLISQGELTDEGLQPRVYEERHSRGVRHLTLDSANVTFDDGSTTAKPLGLQDTASQFVELARRFSTGRQPLVVGSQVPLWLARPQQMNVWTYDVVALETLQIPEFGAVPAFYLRPRPIANPRGVINAEIWFAPSMQYLPVRIRINLGNDNYADLLVNRIDQGAPSASASSVRN